MEKEQTRYPSVYVDRLGRQLSLWAKYGIKDARAFKLMRLWVGHGLTQFMDRQGRYTFHHFNLLRRELGYATVNDMLEDVRLSRSFVLLSCNVDGCLLKDSRYFMPARPDREYKDGLTTFFSPLWHKITSDDGPTLEGSIMTDNSQKNCQNSDCIDNNTLDNNIPTGSTAGAVEASTASGCATMTLAQVEAAEREEMGLILRHVRDYFHSLVDHADLSQREPIEYILWRLQLPKDAKSVKTLPDGSPVPAKSFIRGYGLSADEAHQAMLLMLDTELAPHFARDKQFMSPRNQADPSRRIFQVMGYIKRYSADMMARSVRKMRRRLGDQHRRASAAAIAQLRQNRPISPYEWQLPGGARQYEDDIDGIRPIPSDAPPRPSGTAVWNTCTLQWYEP